MVTRPIALAAIAVLVGAAVVPLDPPALPVAGSSLADFGRIHSDAAPLFQTSSSCIACHNNLSTSSGEDVSIGSDWRASMMANSARDPYWQASVQREIADHPQASAEIQAECATCHMPMSAYTAKVVGRKGEVLAHLPIGQADGDEDLLAADGVSCTVCHQILPDGLGTRESFGGHFQIDPPGAVRRVFGRHEVDSGRQSVMMSVSQHRPTAGPHIRSSELCATCHTLFTDARDPTGRVIGRLPEQVPYLEWKQSDFAKPAATQTCQACHMPVVAESIAISRVLGQPRPGLARHDFRGGNFFILRMLNRYRTELGVVAPPAELEASAKKAIDFLQMETAELQLDSVRRAGGRVEVDVVVRNLAGHKLPTAYPSRRVWIRLAVKDRGGRTVFESGRFGTDGRIVGNANDDDGSAFEPHYREIATPDQVQIYEAIMVDSAGRPTTGLLSAVRFIKDNRVLPAGFEKAAASPDIAVQGTAREDPDFVGGSDRVRYLAPVAGSEGPFRVEAELYYQPIAARWAENLGGYSAPEARRFVSYYSATAASSAVVITRAAVTVPGS
jgi:hypothetical protein